MKIIRKGLCLVLTLSVLLSMAACGGGTTPPAPSATDPAIQEKPTDPKQEATDPTAVTTDPVVMVDPRGVYRCTGIHTQDENEYHEAPAGNAIEIYDDGYGLLYVDDYIYDLHWTAEGNKLTATTVAEVELTLEGTLNGDVLEAVFDGAYLRFEKKSQQEFAEEALDFLRMMMDGTPQQFAVAYLGWKEETEDLQSWMEEKCPSLLDNEAFIPLIPQERIFGTAGEVYCVVPAASNAKVVVRRLQDTPYAEEEGVKEVLYEGESGEPFIVMCNAGDFYQDTQVIFTDKEGNRTNWYPQTGEYGLTFIPSNDALEELGYDFSYYNEVYPYGYNIWRSLGWEPAARENLTDTCWNRYYELVEEDELITYYWTLNLSEDGTAQLDLMGQESTEFRALFTGTWSLNELEDMNTVKLELGCVETDDQFAGEFPQIISDEFVVLRAPEEDNVMFGIREGQEQHPIFTETDNFYSVWWGSVG